MSRYFTGSHSHLSGKKNYFFQRKKWRQWCFTINLLWFCWLFQRNIGDNFSKFMGNYHNFILNDLKIWVCEGFDFLVFGWRLFSVMIYKENWKKDSEKSRRKEEKKKKSRRKGEHFNMLGKEKQRVRSASELIERREANQLEERKRSGLEKRKRIHWRRGSELAWKQQRNEWIVNRKSIVF